MVFETHQHTIKHIHNLTQTHSNTYEILVSKTNQNSTNKAKEYSNSKIKWN